MSGRNLYITFGGGPYESLVGRTMANAPLMGADKVYVYDDLWVTQQPFYRMNRWLWDHPHKRGFGWYAWKPFIIMDALNKCEDGDVVLYVDADTVPISNFSMLYDICRESGGVMLFACEDRVHFHWCKRDCFIVMGLDHPKYFDARDGCARFMLFQKGPWLSQQFLAEWLTYSINPIANTFDPSTIKPEPTGFIEHRAEQAILGNLALKHGIKLWRESCQYGDKSPVTGLQSPLDRDRYGQLFEQVCANTNGRTADVVGSKYRIIP